MITKKILREIKFLPGKIYLIFVLSSCGLCLMPHALWLIVYDYVYGCSKRIYNS